LPAELLAESNALTDREIHVLARNLARRFCVSCTAMRIRLEDLGIVRRLRARAVA
jgi:hypothetical protein